MIRSLFELWKSLRTGPISHRILWWGSLLLLAGMVWGWLPTRLVAIGLWILANGGLGLWVVGWGLFHPRAVVRGARAAIRWAFWLSALGTVLLGSLLRTGLAVSVGLRLTGSDTAVTSLFLFPILCTVTTLVGLGAASLGAYVYRKHPDPGPAVAATVGIGWCALLGAIFLMPFTEETNWGADISAVMVGGVPAFTLWLCFKQAQAPRGPGHYLDLLVRALARRLVLRRRTARRVRLLDLRGPALGLVAALGSLALGSTGLLLPIQAGALINFIHIRNEPPALPFFQRYSASDPARPVRERMVLLQMDQPTRWKSSAQGSLVGTQAEVVRRLRRWGAACIVLPDPLAAPMVSQRQSRRMKPPAPPANTEADHQRSRRDLPKLAEETRAAGNVVLMELPLEGPMPEPFEGAPPGARQNPTRSLGVPTDALRQAAAATGNGALEFFGEARLPALSTEWEELPPVPVAIQRTLAGRPQDAKQPLPALGRAALPFGETRLVPVDFPGSEPGLFAALPYTTVLSGLPIYGAPLTGAGTGKPGWVKPEQYFRNRIVFLDAGDGALLETPSGAMPQAEVLANATAALMSGAFIRMPMPWVGPAVCLLLAVWVGAFSTGRDPLQGAIRTSAVIFVLLAAAAAAFVWFRFWLDPIIPIIAVAVASALATQLTYTIERDERARNRSLLERFVAPSVVEELLDDPDRKLGLGGSRRKICVLFADVRGFTHFAEHNTPEQVIEVTNVYLSAMTEVVYAHHGILDKYTGDGLMALFQVDAETEVGVETAVRTAVAMAAAAKQVSKQLAAQQIEPLHLGISLHYGEVVVGLVGNPRHFNYTALGHTVVVSHRLQSLAGGGDIVISEQVAERVTGRFVLEQLEPVRVKGISQPVAAFRVLGEEAAPDAMD